MALSRLPFVLPVALSQGFVWGPISSYEGAGPQVLPSLGHARGPWPRLPPVAVAVEFRCCARGLECGVRAGGHAAPEAGLCSRSLLRGWLVWLGRLATAPMLGAGVGGGCPHSFRPSRVGLGSLPWGVPPVPGRVDPAWPWMAHSLLPCWAADVICTLMSTIKTKFCRCFFVSFYLLHFLVYI